MSSLFARAAKFARSPQGKRAMQQAVRYARSEKGKQQIAAARQRVTAARAARKPRPPR